MSSSVATVLSVPSGGSFCSLIVTVADTVAVSGAGPPALSLSLSTLLPSLSVMVMSRTPSNVSELLLYCSASMIVLTCVSVAVGSRLISRSAPLLPPLTLSIPGSVLFVSVSWSKGSPASIDTVMMPSPNVSVSRPEVVVRSMSVTFAPVISCTGAVPSPGTVLSSTVDALSVPTSPGGSLTGLIKVSKSTGSDHMSVSRLSSSPTTAEMSELELKVWGVSASRTESAPGVPLKFSTGTKRSCASVGSSMALVSSLAPCGMSVQLVPLSVEYCQVPSVPGSAALPTIAIPPNAVLASAPPVMPV